MAGGEGTAGNTPSDAVPAKSARRRLPFRIRTLDSMAYRDFRLLWLSATTSSTGHFFKTVVIGWLTYNVTGSPILTALSFGLESLPNLVANPIGGVLADRMDKRLLMGGAALYNAALTIGFSALLILYQAEPWQILTYVFLVGMGSSMGQPARTSYAPAVVPDSALLNAFALLSVAYNISKIVGPATAGIMLAAYGPGETIWVAAVLMLASGVIATRLTRVTPEVQGGDRPSMLTQIVEGAAAMARDRVVVALVLTQVVVYGVLVPAVYGLLPVYAADVFHVGPAGLGLLTSSLGVGAIIGVLITASLGSAVPRGKAALVTLAMAGVAMIGLSQTTSYYFAIAMMVLFNAGLVSLTAIKSSGIQSLVPSHLRGRVAALTTMSNGTLPIGSLVFGAIAQVYDAPTATIAAAVVLFASIAGLYLGYPQLRQFR